MGIYLKITGGIFLILSGWGFGIYKALQFKKKENFLLYICLRLDELQNKIRMGAGETKETVSAVFSSCGDIRMQDGVFVYGGKLLEDKDKRMFNELFLSLGKGDRQEECEKIGLYRAMFFERYKLFKEEYSVKSKLWQTFGTCAGISAVLMLI